jgi:pyrroline-5-carboxylate reductase
LESKKTTTTVGGNIGFFLAKELVKNSLCQSETITLTPRNKMDLEELAERSFLKSSPNAEVVLKTECIVLAILPQQINSVLE